jgi:hypothetical protein
MPVPLSASAALKMQTPRKNFANNRFHVLRDDSPAPEERARSNSVKRKEPDCPSFANIVTGTGAKPAPTPQLVVNEVCDMTLEVAKVSSLIDKAATEVVEMIPDPAVATVFNSICDAMRGIVTVQDKVATYILKMPGSVTVPATPATPIPPAPHSEQRDCSMVSLGAIPKKPRSDTNDTSRFPAIVPAANTSRRAETENIDPVKKKFRDTVREAERSTTIFNLDMGKVPLLNRDTMAKRATLALTAMAATKEKKTGSIPSDETIMALDDVLSVTKNYHFIGSGTRTYRNSRDPNSGSFCTAPVRYEFKDKDTRVTAEKVLRARCGVNCSVPYPVMVRESIRQIVNEVKKVHPDQYIRVNVDTTDFVFKIARQPPKGAPDTRWQYGIPDIPIPPCVLDLSVKKVPDDFRLVVPVPAPEQLTGSPRDPPPPLPMQTDTSAEADTNNG